MNGRYYISPSKLYSAVRPLPSKQGFYVPVDSDWVTIAVVAERGPVKLTSPSTSVPSFRTGCDTKHVHASHGKKYISLKLVDLGRNAFDDRGARKGAHGDAVLTMLLFESTPVDSAAPGVRQKKYSSDGSGGAYEACASLTAGTVIAILNAQILRAISVSSPQPIVAISFSS